MSFANKRTDWSLLSALLRLAQREGWSVAFRNGAISLAHQRTERGVVVLPAALLRHAREDGWRISRRPGAFEFRHPAVRHRIELRLVAV